MNFFQSLVLGLVQGMTEFLPISSSGHLALIQHWFGFATPPVSFDITIHFATLLVVLCYFRKKLLELCRQVFVALKKKQLQDFPSIAWPVVVGTLPAVIVGFFLKTYLETIFTSLYLVGAGFLVSAFLLFLTSKCTKTFKTLDQITPKDGLIIGIFQAIAILPGISRSGSTISTGLMKHFTRETAFTFSFILSIPAILGAQLLDLPALLSLPSHKIPSYAIGFVLAFASGYVAIIWLRRIMIRGKLAWFGYYCLILGLMTLFIFS